MEKKMVYMYVCASKSESGSEERETNSDWHNRERTINI